MTPSQILEQGKAILDPILGVHGFQFVPGHFGKSSGGSFASAEYVCGDRRIEVHFRHSLGLVAYHWGSLSIAHEAYMRTLLGTRGPNRYPGFSDDPLDAFRDLAFDLEHFCGDFLSGSGQIFRKCVMDENNYQKLTGIEKLAKHEG